MSVLEIISTSDKLSKAKVNMIILKSNIKFVFFSIDFILFSERLFNSWTKCRNRLST